MKRKVIQLAAKTLVVSLPCKWAKKNGVRKGDEIEVVEDGHTLQLFASMAPQIKSAQYDISNLGVMAGRMLGAHYKAGHDEIKIFFNDPSMMRIVEQELLKGFIGVDIIHQTKDHCVLKAIATVNPQELDNSIRRVFRLLMENANDSLESIKRKDFSELENVAARDMNLNKFADFSRRLLNKFAYPEPRKTNMNYFIIEELEKIGDKYKNICHEIHKNRIRLSNGTIEHYQKVNQFLVLFYELYYNYTDSKCAELGQTYKTLNSEFSGIYHSASKREIEIIAKLDSILTSIFDLSGPLLTSTVL